MISKKKSVKKDGYECPIFGSAKEKRYKGSPF